MSGLPERGSRIHFPEWRDDRARRECPTGGSNQTQKTRCTTACCWAVETPTTEAKVMKGLTRPCADLAASNCEGSSPVRIELALKLTLHAPFFYWCRIPAFQAGEMGSIPIRGASEG